MKVTHTGGVAAVDLRGVAVEWAEFMSALEASRDGRASVATLLFDSGTTATSVPGDAIARLRRFELPLVASLEGTVAGGASTLALGCDVRVAATGSRLTGPGGVTVDGAEALEQGLVSRIAAEGDAPALAREVAATIASRGPIATRLAKEAIWRGLDQRFEQALRFETDLTLLLQTTKDRAEGVAAFLEKRAPSFKGE